MGVALLALACTTAPRPTPPLAPGPATSPWEIPPSDLHTQRLFRLRYEGPEGEGSLRLTLWLAEPTRYRVSTVDPAGRAFWSLSVEGEEGLWLDHRGARFCRFTGELGLGPVPLSPFPLPALPALLLGRVPAAAAEPLEAGADHLRFLDEAGRPWSAETSAGEIRSWTLWEEGEPAVWWHRQGAEAFLSERDRGVQVRWREILREPLAALPPPPEVPPSYAEACGGEI